LGIGSDHGLPPVYDAALMHTDTPVPEGQSKDCPLDPYLIIHSKSTFVDQQTLKLQEAPDMVPVGELPRHMLLSVGRHLTEKVVPSSQIIASGFILSLQSSKNVRCSPYLRAHSTYLSVFNRTFRSQKGLMLFDNLTFAWFTSS
jgi:DNA replication licensing factor MCM5